ncbi:MAG: arylsulfatase [Lentisphaeraceae bacterium]|nr:arylsulfatase [Lentisphaeraceae bacterium]
MALALALSPSSTFAQSKQPALTKPNVIYILADDLGYGDLSCYGQKTLQTPNLDQMAADGMRFTRNYSGSAVCAPSRCTLLTGKHTGHSTIRGNSRILLSKNDVTVADVFKKSGYVTGNFGKWGIGHPPPADNPNTHGFDEFFGYVNMFHAHNFFPEFLIHNGKEVKLRNELMDAFKNQPRDKHGRGVAKEQIDYAPDIIREKMFEFIEKNQQQPFFLLYTPNTPHANNRGADYGRGMEVQDFGPFADKDWPDTEKGFAKMIYDIDLDIKNIRAALQKYGIDKNTLIIFSSDNGPHHEGGHKVNFFDSNGENRGLKRDLYEGGIRVPMIACWPGKIPSNIVNKSIVAFQDLMPTAAEIAKVDCPETDGVSMMPKLLGLEKENLNRALYWEFGEGGGKQAILKGNLKLVRLFKPRERYELYNVVKDPSESQNIIAQYPEVAEQLKKQMFSIPDERSKFKKRK